MKGAEVGIKELIVFLSVARGSFSSTCFMKQVTKHYTHCNGNKAILTDFF